MNKLSPIQQRLLTIYKDFKKACNDHDIHFYAAAGTAIGAIRHHGFIPWDDDIDLVMPIKDFNRFKKLAPKILPNYLAFKESYWMGGKIHDKQTTIIDVRFLNRPQDYHGIYIDIFPLIGLPANQKDRDNFINDIKSFQTNAELLEFYPEISPFSPKQILDWKKYLQTAYDVDSSDQLAAFCFFLCNGAGIKNPLTVPFEDTDIPISSNYDSDLKQHFGDYMTLPPKEKRKSHDKYHLIDLDTPFAKYAKSYPKTQQWLLQLIKQEHQIAGELTQLSNSLQFILDEKTAKLSQTEHQLKQTRDQLKALEEEVKLLRNSKSYRIGQSILAPLKPFKKGSHHEK